MFLHGLMGSAANWRRIVRDFEKEFEVLTYDQRGHGRSFHPDDGYEPEQFAADLRQILDELGWDKIYLVGHSMGGRNSLEFAHQNPQRVIKLVLEDISPGNSGMVMAKIERLLQLVPTPFANRAEAKEFFENVYPSRISFYSKPVALSRYFYSNIIETPTGQADWRFSKDAILKSLYQGRNKERWNEFRELKIPTLVIRGQHSDDLPRDVFERMLKENPTYVRGVEIADSGHWVHFDQPEAFIGALKTFFQASSL